MPCDVLVRSRSSVCVPCKGSIEQDEPDCDDTMSTRSGRKQIYETAFDSRVSKSEDELDEVDRVSNHPVLRMFSRAARGLTPRGNRKKNKEKESPDPQEGPSQTPRPISAIPGHLAAELSAMRISTPPPPSAPSPIHTYTPSPPSTAPLPAKFHTPTPMNSIQSAPNLPAGSPARLKDLRLPVKSLKARNRPTSLLIAGVQASHRPKYSSTESMATSSSSMSSLDSLRSSTSEGNRSSTSSGSRSDSLSSHSSDSGGDLRRVMPTRCAPLGLLSNKLHILSPISDKSQEPGSETSDNNRNNNSQKASPEEAATAATPTAATDDLPWDAPKLRRRMQNKNVINLQFGAPKDILQGSDSGISIESRQFENLPFDMPKLRRRLTAAASSATSSSATSVASSSKPEDLPFDMPKLRRKLRPASTFEPMSSNSSVLCTTTDSNATDSAGGGPVRPPSLDLGGPSAFRPVLSSSNRPGGLSLNFGFGALSARGDEVDVQIPLERQGWFHGAITRIEAEAELRLHPEGSYLVRNSESSRQDFSLSLKSARGFMHMRIQQDTDTGQYILGQFSKPFSSIPEMVYHYSINRLPIRGAEHMCLLHPVIEQLL
ncbi:serine/arginine repetitive matrix protein 1 isoform X2 [Neocloeon triangulifer]|nr:serine/arginine repetitive matrix protein 1 isoform X2 [Neocloeon triangulifer]